MDSVLIDRPSFPQEVAVQEANMHLQSLESALGRYKMLLLFPQMK